MKTIKLSMLSILIFIIALTFTPCSALAAFSASDLQGTWYAHSLYSGYYPGWDQGTFTVGNDGSVSFNETDSDGQTEKGSVGTFSISSNGIITVNGNPNIHGVMNADKNIVVFIETDTDPDTQGVTYGLTVLIRGGGSFSQSNLTGTWYEHSLSSGQYPGWEYGKSTIDSQGNVSVNTTDSDGNQQIKSNAAKISISGNGIISEDGNTSMNGVMSSDDNFVAFTDTSDQGGSYHLTVLVRGGGSFSSSDLTGTWYSHSIMSGSNWGDWTYGPIKIDSSGSAAAHAIMSDNTSESGTYTLSITPSGTDSGTITAAESNSFNGIMNLGKNITVFTETDDASAGSGYNLMIAMKVSDSVPFAGFSATPLSGKKPLQVMFTDSSSGDITGWSWDFGDGSTSTDQNPSHTYSKPGKYNVSLTATGPDGTDVDTKAGYVSVKSPGMSWLSILLGQ